MGITSITPMTVELGIKMVETVSLNGFPGQWVVGRGTWRCFVVLLLRDLMVSALWFVERNVASSSRIWVTLTLGTDISSAEATLMMSRLDFGRSLKGFPW